MKLFSAIGLASIAFVFSCGNPIYMASRLPGLRQISDTMVEKEFVDWMESDPAAEVRARVARHHYELLGLVIYSDKDYWIPGIAGHKATHGRYDVTWQGMGGANKKHIPLAENYMTRFNRLMVIERRGVPLDVYGRGQKHLKYIPDNLHQ